jgi:hypothetical protein
MCGELTKFSPETPRKRVYLEDQGGEENIILKQILKARI